MISVRRIAKNSGAYLLIQISNPLSSLVLVFFIARYLGVSGLGEFSAALSLLYIFQAFSSLGFTYLVTRDVSQDKSQAGRYLVNTCFLTTGFSLILIPVMGLVVHIITDNTNIIKAVYILSFSLIPYSIATVCESICKAFEKVEYITISNVTSNFFKVIFGLILLFKGYGIEYIMWVILGSLIFYCSISFFFTLRLIPKKTFKLSYNFCIWALKVTSVFALIIIINTVRWNIDTLLLASMMSEKDVGFYSAASKLMNVGKLGLSGFVVAIQPVIFRLYKFEKAKFTILCKESMRYLLILLIPIAFGTTLLSERFILLVFKSEFLPAAYALKIIIWILVFAGGNLIFANALVASNYQTINLKGIIIGLIANTSLSLALIPKLGFIGASISNIVSAMIFFVFQYYYISKYLFKVDYLQQAKKPVLASVFMGIAILAFEDVNLFFLILLSIVIYSISLIALKTFVAQDINLLKRLLRGEKVPNVAQGDA